MPTTQPPAKAASIPLHPLFPEIVVSLRQIKDKKELNAIAERFGVGRYQLRRWYHREIEKTENVFTPTRAKKEVLEQQLVLGTESITWSNENEAIFSAIVVEGTDVITQIKDLLTACGHDPDDFSVELVRRERITKRNPAAWVRDKEDAKLPAEQPSLPELERGLNVVIRAIERAATDEQTEKLEQKRDELVESIANYDVAQILTPVGAKWSAYTTESVIVTDSVTYKIVRVDTIAADKFVFTNFVFNRTEKVLSQKDISADGLIHGIMFPDAQLGYFMKSDGEWDTSHDEKAIDVSLQLLQLAQEKYTLDLVIDGGDFNDQAMFGKHRSSLGHLDRGAFYKSQKRGFELLCERTLLSPNAARWMLRGNHDDRLLLKLMDEMPSLVGVKDPTTDELLLSLERLYGTREAGWKITPAYPEGFVQIAPNFRAVHGPHASAKPGAAGAKYLTKEEHILFNHTNHPQIVTRQVVKGHDQRNWIAACGGTLGRVDGVVPSATGRYRDDGTPQAEVGNEWGQGVILFHADPEGLWTPSIELVVIEKGRAIYDGTVITSRM